MNKLASFILVFFVSSSAVFSAMKCGNFVLKVHDDGVMYINGVKPETQKITFFGRKDDYDNVKFQWMLLDPSMGKWLGLDHVNRNGKPILNVEVIRKNMDEPRRFWSYDCVRVK
ncbi:hypothetical protein [Pectobacterium carotovorum]|uniref:hypothetical protein n=1 Tax=Pectobacterium carotovorum TaxID=554 RepID=UPI003016B5AE